MVQTQGHLLPCKTGRLCVQTRYILGDVGQSLVVGYGLNPPSHVQNEAASCPPAPITCNAVSAQLSPNPNPNVIAGALVEGGIFSDTFQVRCLIKPCQHVPSLACYTNCFGRGSKNGWAMAGFPSYQLIRGLIGQVGLEAAREAVHACMP